MLYIVNLAELDNKKEIKFLNATMSVEPSRTVKSLVYAKLFQLKLRIIHSLQFKYIVNWGSSLINDVTVLVSLWR